MQRATWAPLPDVNPTSEEQRHVDEYVNQNLNLTQFAQRNRCADLTCIFQKLVYHKVYRGMNYWQSFLLHRYFWNVQHTPQGSGLNVHHMQLKKIVRKGDNPIPTWVYADSVMSPATWIVSGENPSPEPNRENTFNHIIVVLAEM